MWCDNCAYYSEVPNPATCRSCGRYIHNKQGQLAAVFILAVVFAIFSHYLLSGRWFGGSDLVWVQSGLAAPCPIYESAACQAYVGLTLAALVMIPALTAFHFGLALGLMVAFLMGLFSGVYLGAVALPTVAAFSGVRRTKTAPPVTWLILSALAGLAYYLALAWRYGPRGEPLYGAALKDYLLWVGLFMTVLAVVCGLLAAALRYNSAQVVAAAVLLALAPTLVFFRWVGPSRLEARLVEFSFNPAKLLNAELPEGFASGAAPGEAKELTPKRQLAHVLDASRYVDDVRMKAKEACDAYLKRYPVSDDAPDVMLLDAEMLNMRMDVDALKRYNRLVTYADRIAEGSVPVYQGIVTRFPDAPQAALARYYIAEATFQAGRITEAMALMASAEKALAAVVPASFSPSDGAPPAKAADLYGGREARERRLLTLLYEALAETRRKESLIAHNSDFSGQPLARFAMLDPRMDTFASDAQEILGTYGDSKLADNIRLTLAEQLSDPVERRNAVEALIDAAPISDVADRMLLVAAKAELAGDLSGQGSHRAELKLRRLIADYPSSTYRAEAARLLARVAAGTK